MSHDTPTIEVQRRDRVGTRYAQRLRQEGRLPAIIYGHKTDPVSVSVDEHEILRLLHQGAHVVELKLEGASPETCLVRDLQFGYLGDNVIHIDFARVDLDEKVNVKVGLVWVGTPEAANQTGAIVNHDQTELSVRCTVRSIPDEIEVDLALMDGTQMTAGEVALPENTELLDDPTATIVSIGFVREEAEGEEADPTAEGSAEPEVIAEGKEGESD